MSMRTIIEINHDYIHDLVNHPNEVRLWIASLGFLCEREAAEKAMPGLRVLGQRHHSEELTLKVK